MNRRLVLGLWLACIALCLWQVARTTFTADMSAFLPRAPTPEQRLLVDQLKEGAVARLILIGIEGSDLAERARLSKALATTLRGDPQFASVANGEAVELERDRELLFRHRYALSPTVDAQRFEVAGLRAALSESIDLLASPAGLLQKTLLPRDPTGELMQILNGLGGESRPASRDGVWVSSDGARALLIVRTRAAGSDIDGQERALAAIRAAFDAAQPDSASRLLLAGHGVFAVAARSSIKGEVTRLFSLGLLIIACLLLLIYRSPAALGLGLLPVLTGALAGVAAVSLGFGTVHGITLGFGTALIGEAVDYAIYLFVQSERNTDSDGLSRFWPTIRLGVLTSVAGFASLLFSGFPGLAQLGLYAISGLVVAALVTRYVLPVLIPAGFAIRDVSSLGQRLRTLAQAAPCLRWPLVGLLVAAGVVLVTRSDGVWNRELAALSPVTAEDQMLDARLRADLGAPDARYLVAVTGTDAEAALVAAEQVTQHLQILVEQGVIAGLDSPATYLPSAATQAARLAALPAEAELRARLREAVRDLPVRPETFEPFLADVAAARGGKPLTRADLEGSTMAAAVDALLVPPSPGEDGPWLALLPLRAPSSGSSVFSIDADQVREALADAVGGRALFIDLKAESDQLYSTYLNEAIALSLAGFAAILVLLFASLRSFSRLVRVTLPLVAAVLTVSAGLILSGQTLTLLHGVGLLLVIAVGSNYALFFDLAEMAPRTLASLLFANLTTVAGFGLLGFSHVPVLQAIGSTVGPGAILALVFAAVFARRPATSA